MAANTGLRQDQFVTVEGLTVRYWDQGTGPPVILLHGLGGSIEFWQPNIESLARCHRVLALDIPGFGRSAKSLPSYSLDYVVVFLRSLFEELEVSRASLIGNSMGGLIALRFALEHPELVDRMVLAGSAGLGRCVSFSLRALSIPLIGEWIIGRMDRQRLRQTLRGLYCNPELLDEQLVEVNLAHMSQPGARAALVRVARSGISIFGQKRQIVMTHRLHELEAPALIIWGREDRVIPVSHALATHQCIPGSQLHILERCGHCPQIERPEEFNAVVRGFLSQTLASPINRSESYE